MQNTNTDYFLTIVTEGSLTKAAQKLFISQPSLSQYLKRLESSLGIELFDHSSSPLRLTYAGKKYYDYLLQIKNLSNTMQQQIEDIKNEKSGRIRLGVALWRGACLLPQVFPEFHREYPNIQLELSEGKSHTFLKEILDDNIDLGIANIAADIHFDKFEIEVFKNERILLGVPTKDDYVQNLLTKTKIINGVPKAPIDILQHFPLIMTTPGQNITKQLEAFFLAKKITPDILLRTSNLTTGINLTAEGCGCVFVPEEGASTCKRDGSVTYFTLEQPELTWNLAAIYKKNAYINHICRLFIDYCKKLIH